MSIWADSKGDKPTPAIPSATAGGVELSCLVARADLDIHRRRTRWLTLFFMIPFLVIMGRLWLLQVGETDDLARKARSNLVRTSEIGADRGMIYDRSGRLVAGNRVAYDVVVDPRHFQDKPEALALLREFLSLSEADVAGINKRMAAKSKREFVARRDVSRNQIALVETNRVRLPGVSVETRAQRHYPYNELSAHTIGFMNEITGSELERLKEYRYALGDYIGRTGVERSYESILRGSPGFDRKVVDAKGIPQGDEAAEELLGHYRRVEPVPGRDLRLTVDMELQEIMLEALAEHVSGAAVAIDPRDGSVLGLLSKPTFNPNSWTGRLSAEEKRRVDTDPFKPMVDKTTHSWFPGSTFKLVSAAAALGEGYIRPEETLRCPGYYEFGNRRFHCWHRAGHGSINLVDSLKYSCDVYYYKLGEKMGMDRLAQYAYMFGFGERTGIGINGESRGLVPTKDWHRKHSPEGFQHGFTLSTAVGQGDTRVSPLQTALAFGALANGGKLYYPRLVDRIETAEGNVLFEYPARVRRELELAPEIVREIDVGMTAVLNEPGGTAHKHRLNYVNIAGKTGTAQVRGFGRQRLVNGEVTLRHRDHSWFVGYGPAEDPRIVVVVFVEHGGSGSRVAAPVAMKILDRYFREIEGMDPNGRPAFAARGGPRRLGRDSPPRWVRPGSAGLGVEDSFLFGSVETPIERPGRLERAVRKADKAANAAPVDDVPSNPPPSGAGGDGNAAVQGEDAESEGPPSKSDNSEAEPE